MSIILITEHDENIYNIVDQSESERLRQKGIGFKLKRHKKSRQYKQRCLKDHATMGVPIIDPPDPEQFLRKHTGKPAYPTCLPEKEPKISIAKKFPTPQTKELLQKIKEEQEKEKEEKNFVRENVKVVKNMKAKEPEPQVAIDRVGHTVKPLKNGWEPVYIKSQYFGKTPKYLVNFMKIREREYQLKKDTTTAQQPLCRYVTRDERERLLFGLKKNWKELQKTYQGLPILTDTIPKKIRKTKLENDLKQLEKDIVLLERHPYIYVYDDNTLLP